MVVEAMMPLGIKVVPPQQERDENLRLQQQRRNSINGCFKHAKLEAICIPQTSSAHSENSRCGSFIDTEDRELEQLPALAPDLMAKLMRMEANSKRKSAEEILSWQISYVSTPTVVAVEKTDMMGNGDEEDASTEGSASGTRKQRRRATQGGGDAQAESEEGSSTRKAPGDRPRRGSKSAKLRAKWRRSAAAAKQLQLEGGYKRPQDGSAGEDVTDTETGSEHPPSTKGVKRKIKRGSHGSRSRVVLDTLGTEGDEEANKINTLADINNSPDGRSHRSKRRPGGANKAKRRSADPDTSPRQQQQDNSIRRSSDETGSVRRLPPMTGTPIAPGTQVVGGSRIKNSFLTLKSEDFDMEVSGRLWGNYSEHEDNIDEGNISRPSSQEDRIDSSRGQGSTPLSVDGARDANTPRSLAKTRDSGSPLPKRLPHLGEVQGENTESSRSIRSFSVPVPKNTGSIDKERDRRKHTSFVGLPSIGGKGVGVTGAHNGMSAQAMMKQAIENVKLSKTPLRFLSAAYWKGRKVKP